jgi:hypothetical protein
MSDDVVGDMNYLTSTSDDCPAWLTASPVPTALGSNVVRAPIRVTIHDLQGKEKSVNLDTNAFEVLKYEGSIQEEFEEGSEAQQTYYEEITGILKKRLRASRVIIYHYTFRSRGLARTDDQVDKSHRKPVYYPHVETDPLGSQKIVEKLLDKEEAERVMHNRIQVVNIWRRWVLIQSQKSH